MRFNGTFVLVLALTGAAGHWIIASKAEESCLPIEFGDRKDTIVISGSVLPKQTRCYRLDGEGQKVTVKVLSGKNIFFSIEDVVADAQEAFTFTAENMSYRVIVGQLLRSTRSQAFQISIAKSSTQP